MTSIIGYTRVPYSSIEPVKRIDTHQPFLNKTNGIIEILKKEKAVEYNTKLCINISNRYENYSGNNLKSLIEYIKKTSMEKSVQFQEIIHFLKKLQKYNHHQFLCSFDKENESIVIYFPNTVSVNLNQTFNWLKSNVNLNLNHYKNWSLALNTTDHCDFDGESYFKDIYKFINQVDELIEFSNKKFNNES